MPETVQVSSLDTKPLGLSPPRREASRLVGTHNPAIVPDRPIDVPPGVSAPSNLVQAPVRSQFSPLSALAPHEVIPLRRHEKPLVPESTILPARRSWLHRLVHAIIGLVCSLFRLLFRWSFKRGEPTLEKLGSTSRSTLGRQTPSGIEIEILVWNLEKCGGNVVQDLGDLMRKADLVIAQEASQKPQVLTLMRDSGMDWRMASSIELRRVPTGVLTGSRASPLRTAFVASKTREPFLRTPKMTLLCEYALPQSSERLLVVNVHGLNFAGYSRGFARQIHQLDKAMKGHSGPLILAGDFNTWNNKRQRILDDLARRHGATPPAWGPGRQSAFGHALDHVYVRGLTIERADILTNIESSDHPPLRLTLRLVQNNRHSPRRPRGKKIRSGQTT